MKLEPLNLKDLFKPKTNKLYQELTTPMPEFYHQEPFMMPTGNLLPKTETVMNQEIAPVEPRPNALLVFWLNP